jgi:L-ascorbate metabolism protein UlaG (beta-lactamase superfamily)
LPDEVRQSTTALADLFRKNKSWRPPCRTDLTAALDPASAHLTWIGHSTFLLRLGEHWILTDPVFGHPAATLWRHVPPGLAPEQLPSVDIVAVSHDHYDHLDLPSLANLKGEPEIIAPLQVSRTLPRPATELDWWDVVDRSGLRITMTPAHHWAMRGLSSRNRTLWGGLVFQAGDLTVYFAGDTAFQPPVFEAIRARFPRIDVALLPIGAYAPRWFMHAQHMGPEEAVDAYEMLGARKFVAMHWGTFHLSSEPIRQPIDLLKARWAARGHASDDLWILDIGETRRL